MLFSRAFCGRNKILSSPFFKLNLLHPSIVYSYCSAATQAEPLFEEIWTELKNKYSEKNLIFPKELIWLGGAPGSGKGTNTNFILRERGLSSEPIVMSSLLNSPEHQSLKAKGVLIGDKEVIFSLAEELLKDKYRKGVLIDGFPRTEVQAEVTQKLFDQICTLYRVHSNVNPDFTRPIFRICVLYVNGSTSVERQLARGARAYENNKRVNENGEGELQEIRNTDFDPILAKQRYDVFLNQTMPALEYLGKHFIYNFINAQGTIETVEKNIINEMKYQSKNELSESTHTTIRDLLRASEITIHARQKLVRRLDDYSKKSSDLFKSVVKHLNDEIYPIIELNSISGFCYVHLQDKIYDNPIVIQMVIDILSDRGFLVSCEKTHDDSICFHIRWRSFSVRS
eukprot:TRINITY_DN15838_c0_g1_i1.p1 TRINITY_DN15838_c0_g1~~TRINITY_DN15838_c0_g1_i1.p1  ORF type:complete len:398 (+),score=94.13 TRINITY_DN15838_c0_g1_i1:44-1237(+)